MLCWVCAAVPIIFSNLCSSRFCIISSRGSEPAFVQLPWVTESDAVAPAVGCKADCTLQHRLTEDMQHLARNTKESKLPLSALSLHVDGLNIAFPVQSDVQVSSTTSNSSPRNSIHLNPKHAYSYIYSIRKRSNSLSGPILMSTSYRLKQLSIQWSAITLKPLTG